MTEAQAAAIVVGIRSMALLRALVRRRGLTTALYKPWTRRCGYSSSTNERDGIVDAVVSSRDKGLAFEARVERVMRAVGCALVPTQASMDGGIDHEGRWVLPDMELNVVTQCKHEQKPVGVQYLREFYGVLGVRASPTTLAMFFSSSGYSIYAQRFFARTLHPAVLCTVAEDDRIVEFLLNDRARAALPRLAVGSCFVDHEHELILTYGDQVLGS